MAVKVRAHPYFVSSLAQTVLYPLSDQVATCWLPRYHFGPTLTELHGVVDQINREREDDSSQRTFWGEDSQYDIPFCVGYNITIELNNGSPLQYAFCTLSSELYEMVVIEDWLLNRETAEFERIRFVEYHLDLAPTAERKRSYLDLITNMVGRAKVGLRERQWLDIELSEMGSDYDIHLALDRLVEWCAKAKANIAKDFSPLGPKRDRKSDELSIKEKALVLAILQTSDLFKEQNQSQLSVREYYSLLSLLVGGSYNTLYNYVTSIDGADGAKDDIINNYVLDKIASKMNSMAVSRS